MAQATDPKTAGMPPPARSSSTSELMQRMSATGTWSCQLHMYASARFGASMRSEVRTGNHLPRDGPPLEIHLWTRTRQATSSRAERIDSGMTLQREKPPRSSIRSLGMNIRCSP